MRESKTLMAVQVFTKARKSLGLGSRTAPASGSPGLNQFLPLDLFPTFVLSWRVIFQCPFKDGHVEIQFLLLGVKLNNGQRGMTTPVGRPAAIFWSFRVRGQTLRVNMYRGDLNTLIYLTDGRLDRTSSVPCLSSV